MTAAAHLEDVFDDSVRGTEQVDAGDASHFGLHGTRRQVLLPQTWNQHSEHHVQRGGAIFMLHRTQPEYKEEERDTTQVNKTIECQTI